jgi:hypothetical protein
MHTAGGFFVAALLVSFSAWADADVQAITRCQVAFMGDARPSYFQTEGPGSLCPVNSGCSIRAWQGELTIMRKDGSKEVNETDETKSAFLDSTIGWWPGAVMNIRGFDLAIRSIYDRAKSTGARISELTGEFQGNQLSLAELQKRRQKELDKLNGRWAKIEACKKEIGGRVPVWRQTGLSKLAYTAGYTMKRATEYQEIISAVIHAQPGEVDDKWIKAHTSVAAAN